MHTADFLIDADLDTISASKPSAKASFFTLALINKMVGKDAAKSRLFRQLQRNFLYRANLTVTSFGGRALQSWNDIVDCVCPTVTRMGLISPKKTLYIDSFPYKTTLKSVFACAYCSDPFP